LKGPKQDLPEVEFDLRQLQLTELEALCELRRVCQLLELPFYLVGGTALGAVRHQGFIPWDDDIDIGLLRPDYDRLLREAPALLGERFFLQTNRSDPEYYLGYAKLRINDTLYVQRNFADRKMHHGVFVDIFPLDGVPNSGLGRKWQHSLEQMCYFFGRGEPVNRGGKVVRAVSAAVLALLPRKLELAISRGCEKAAARLPREGEMVANIYGMAGYWREIMPLTYMGTPVPGSFEGEQMPLPACYDEYLTHLYRDYMQLPPPEARAPKHDAVAVTLGK